jgi:cytosine/adenosine deaminase-related metal-dependent hydrolase
VENFTGILKNLWWTLDRKLDPETIKACTEIAVQQCILNGVTYVFDHHSSPNSITGSLPIIAKILRDYHLRGVLCYETSDRNNETGSELAFRENSDFIRSGADDDVKGMLGLHACFTLSDDTLLQAQKIVRELSAPIHIHLAEDEADVEYCRKMYNLSPAERLAKYDLLGPECLLIHGVHLNGKDYEILSKAGCPIVYNPDSNLNNAVGLPDFASVPQNIPVLAGTDGMHANVHRSLKQLFLLYRMQHHSFEKAFQWLKKIYFDQINYVKRWFPDYPTLHEGNRADMVLWDYIPATPFQEDNYFGHLIYGLTESRVHTVLQNGEILMRDFKFVKNERNRSIQALLKQGKNLYDRMGNS